MLFCCFFLLSFSSLESFFNYILLSNNTPHVARRAPTCSHMAVGERGRQPRGRERLRPRAAALVRPQALERARDQTHPRRRRLDRVQPRERYVLSFTSFLYVLLPPCAEFTRSLVWLTNGSRVTKYSCFSMCPAPPLALAPLLFQFPLLPLPLPCLSLSLE